MEDIMKKIVGFILAFNVVSAMPPGAGSSDAVKCDVQYPEAKSAASKIWNDFQENIEEKNVFYNFVNILNGGICDKPWSTVAGLAVFKKTLAESYIGFAKKQYSLCSDNSQKRLIAERAYIVLFPLRGMKTVAEDTETVNSWLCETAERVETVSYKGKMDRRIVDHMGHIYSILQSINKYLAENLKHYLRMMGVVIKSK
jgi:hypothetical protein